MRIIALIIRISDTLANYGIIFVIAATTMISPCLANLKGVF